MPRGDKSSYSDKQKRQAEHIEESEREQGRSEAAAERIAWATVNKQDGGAKGSGRKTATKKTASKKSTTKKTAKKTASKKSTSKK
ncbi:plasmid stabilization system protein ParE [Pseudoxanthomonas sacheonensis]|uniref:Plasmid stabilization system protein ParE n=1 Tax=Pseudoxanthomonas sacheonensis TaxID=443615 RepID=A0ABU1RRT1_9GAMM|nr:plasmid stabilization system protein ParE [Pseudoxanthomonas sacheonensis]